MNRIYSGVPKGTQIDVEKKGRFYKLSAFLLNIHILGLLAIPVIVVQGCTSCVIKSIWWPELGASLWKIISAELIKVKGQMFHERNYVNRNFLNVIGR